MSPVWSSVKPLTWSPITFFSPNWKHMDLMGGLFDRWGTGCKIIHREWWWMAQCSDGDQWQVVSIRGHYWDWYSLISSVTLTVGLSSLSASLWMTPRRVVQLTCPRNGMLSRDTYRGSRSGPRKTSWVQDLGCGNFHYQYRLGDIRIEHSPA